MLMLYFLSEPGGAVKKLLSKVQVFWDAEWRHVIVSL